MPLRELLPEVGKACHDCVVEGLAMDSRQCRPGYAFVAVQGTRGHGLDYAAAAVSAGAQCIISDREPGAEVGVPVIVIVDLEKRLLEIASRFYPAEALPKTLIGVTGTNGKTSVAWFLAQLLTPAHRCAFMGTLGYGAVDALTSQALTTPDLFAVRRTLSELAQQGFDAVAMEVSSHALEQGRVQGLPITVGVFTNLSRDHLDYHETMEAYAAAKLRLFTRHQLALAVINRDDATARSWLPDLKKTPAKIVSYGRGADADTDVALRDVALEPGAMSFTLSVDGDDLTARTQLLAEFNAMNAAAAIAVASQLGVTHEQLAEGLAQLRAAPGRMESFGGGALPLVVVDYAHTPDALEKALLALRAQTSGQLLVVFGCGGDRDRGKRPLMGGVAEQLADSVYLTSDNPRSEAPEKIIDDIEAGMQRTARVIRITDRQRAIQQAIGQGGSGDSILVAGKGHENTQQFADRRIHFDDREEVRQALKARAA